MDINRILTIDPAATREKLTKDGRTVAPYARSRGFSETTMAQILSGRFPFNGQPGSVFQRALQSLQKDGYLVEATADEEAA